MRSIVRRLIPLLRRKAVPAVASIHEQNFGVNLLEWPERATEAMAMLGPYLDELGPAPVVADWGCGRQIIRRLIPAEWEYRPYDRIQRSADTRLHDFNLGAPPDNADLIFCLGLLEYVDDFWGVLEAAVGQSRFCVFSYVGAASEEQRIKNGWKSGFPVQEVEEFLKVRGVTCLRHLDKPATGQVFLVGGGLR